MNKNLWLIILIAAIVIVGGVFIFKGNSGDISQGSTPGSSLGGASGTVETGGNDAPLDDVSGDTDTSGKDVVITVDAQRWQYSMSTITVKKGDHVKIIINNKDTTHGMTIPEYGVSGIDSIEFTADKSGTFEFRCPTPCGSGHMGMKGTLVVEA